ncbi:MAG: hypothetical protein IJR17_01355 [Clostridia bacterium]|nr:hypothetical protein [Clostridia bacterium]
MGKSGKVIHSQKARNIATWWIRRWTMWINIGEKVRFGSFWTENAKNHGMLRFLADGRRGWGQII